MTLATAPWLDPQVGDACTTSRGKTRAARSVLRGGVGGTVPLKVTHEDGDGAILTVAAGTWATWCAWAVRHDGKYERSSDV